MPQSFHPLPPRAAFAELARITLADHSLESVMGKIAALTKQTIPRATEASVTLLERAQPKTVACTGPLALRLDERQYERRSGPCLASVEGGQPVVINDLAADDRWADWSAEAVAAGARSSLSLSVPLQREVSAGLNIYSTHEHAFDPESIQLAQTFSTYAGVVLANVHLYEAQAQVAQQLQTAMQSRAVIEQAKGILMGERRCSAGDAFTALVRMSQDSNRKLRDVAQELVDRVIPTD